jgi:hypothetical protein
MLFEVTCGLCKKLVRSPRHIPLGWVWVRAVSYTLMLVCSQACASRTLQTEE